MKERIMDMQRKDFYVGIVGEKGAPYTDDIFEICIKHKYYSVREAAKQKGVFRNITTGSILILGYDRKFIAYGEVINTTCLCMPDNRIKQHRLLQPHVHVKEWIFFDRNSEETILKNGIEKMVGVSKKGIADATLAGGQHSIVKKIEPNFALGKINPGHKP